MKLIAFSAVVTLLLCQQSFAAIQTARIHQRIYPALDVKRVSDMYFPDAYPGSPSFKIEAGSSEAAHNASFLVTGEPGKRVSVIMPSERVVLQSQQGTSRIHVSHFTSNTGQSAMLNRDGELKIYVGATREEIPARTPSGDYSGSFCVTVMY